MTLEAPKSNADQPLQAGFSSNVKTFPNRRRREPFGEVIRYLTVEELQHFFDAIEDYRHKLMMRVIYELGCRVGEFVRIRFRHLSFSRNTVYIPAENKKTRQRRVSHLPVGLMNEIESVLRAEARMTRRSERISTTDDYEFFPVQTHSVGTPKTASATSFAITRTRPD